LKVDPRLKLTLLPIDKLKPHEKGLALYLQLLKQEILRDGMLKCPIIADESSLVILDGMHRWLALKSLGYLDMPVILVDARRQTGIRIGKRRVHQYLIDPAQEIDIEEVISAGLGRQLMEPRSTRHFFPFSKRQEIDCPLSFLRRGREQDVSGYLSESSIERSDAMMDDWLEEISEELQFLVKRKEEVEKEKLELIGRINHLRRCSALSR
jgi:hypothetical protein